ncbi:MAG: tRNA dihydrouridine synthase DusB [Parvularcula sp.]
MALVIGKHTISPPVLLAPMSGITDLPFRRAVWRAGGGYVVSEMVASEDLVKARQDVVLRSAMGTDRTDGLNVIQLAGREAHWMAEGARVAQARGADIIDINMGCPARKVTGALSGSALMRDPHHAVSLIEAVLSGTSLPVTLKMRLGWDHSEMTGVEIARRAEAAGVSMITVHGRTRQQFYKGQADWPAIAEISRAVTIPVIANGDIVDVATAKAAQTQAEAEGVMIGRAAEGRPWFVAALAQALATGEPLIVPPADEQARQMALFYQDLIDHYREGHGRGEEAGERLGVRMARKHLAAFVDHLPVTFSPQDRRALRGALCQSTAPGEVYDRLVALSEHPASRGRPPEMCLFGNKTVENMPHIG